MEYVRGPAATENNISICAITHGYLPFRKENKL